MKLRQSQHQAQHQEQEKHALPGMGDDPHPGAPEALAGKGEEEHTCNDAPY